MDNAANYTWETEFRTADNLMIHTFSDRVKVVSNIKTGEVKILRDGEVISRRKDMLLIMEYEKMLISIAADANKLKAFRP